MASLEEAIKLREEKQYEKSRTMFLQLTKDSVDPEVYYLCAWTHDAMELEKEAVVFYRILPTESPRFQSWDERRRCSVSPSGDA